MALIRSRQALVGCRTQLVNHVRGAVKSFGARLPKCPARSFHKRPRAHPRGAHAGSWAHPGAEIGSLTQRIATTSASWRGSLKVITQKPSSCVRSRGSGRSGRSGRSPSCSPWKIPTALQRAAAWVPILWGWCPPGISREIAHSPSPLLLSSRVLLCQENG